MAIDELDPTTGAAVEPASEAGEPTVGAEGEGQVDTSQQDDQPISAQDFRKFQSALDKQIAELRKQNEELKKATRQPPPGPGPEERRRQQELMTQWQQLNAQIETAQEAGETEQILKISRQLAFVERDMVQADLTIAALEAGVDPQHPDLVKAMRNGKFTNPSDIAAAVWKVKAQEVGSGSESLAKRAQELDKREATLSDTIAAEVKKAVAAVRQELGLNAIPGVKPGGTSAGTIQQQLAAAKEAGNMMEVLRLKRQLKE